jgi:hypothetical protein
MLTRPADSDEFFAHDYEFLELNNRKAYGKFWQEAKENVSGR